MSSSLHNASPTRFIGENGDDASEIEAIAAESRKTSIGVGQPIGAPGARPNAPTAAQTASPPLSEAQFKGVKILDSWIAAEVLAPVTVKEIKDVTVGRERDMAALEIVLNDALPWEEGYPETDFPRGRSGYIAYDVILGVIPENKASVRLAQTFGQSFNEGGNSSDISLVATLRVMPDGTLNYEELGDPLTISAYSWGIVRAMGRDFASLPDWARASKGLSDKFQEQFASRFETQPIDKAGILEIYYWMLDQIGMDESFVSRPAQSTDLVNKPSKVIGHYQRVTPEGLPVPNQKKPDSLIMDSFFLSDLMNARKDLKEGKPQPALDRYLGVKEQARRINILEDPKAIQMLLRPQLFPAGKWPHARRNQLVTMQQSIINYALHPAQTRRNKVIGVNGPPGTGKTTLLKDMAAALIVQRAIAMSEFINPSQAFSYIAPPGNRRSGRALKSVYQLNEKLIGFEMLVASSNNGAVENVSNEWPEIGSIAEDVGTTYFPGTASRLHDKNSWGLISAALGNAANRRKFREQFWFDEDWGLRGQLAFAAGRPVTITEPETNKKRFPASIEAHRPPSSRREAVDRWNRARTNFLRQLEIVRNGLSDLEKKSIGILDTRDPNRFHTSSPWLSMDQHRERENLFEAAIALHRAFIEGAASEMSSNLSAAMDLLSGRLDSQTRVVVQSVLSSLFIAVPVLSTTFASVSNMLGRVEDGMIGWLLIDEAGQATPQSAVGALKRSRNAMVVGDPIQVEPVVSLSEPLIIEIAKAFGINHETDMAPWASAQTFADGASEVFAEYPSMDQPRRVGMPLLAHRRCAEPMFSISNHIGYGGLMVNAKRPGHSAIRETCGPSRWIDVVDPSGEKWSEQEGLAVLNLLRAIVAQGGKLDLYIISPFRVIESRLRDMVIQNHATIGISFAEAREFIKRIGTVHKVQGREAEAVIMVLGHQGDAFKRAREWAGSRPNIPNVAVTRAKEVLYVVGNRADWSEAGFFHTVDQVMDDFSMAHPYAPEAEAALFAPPPAAPDPAATPAPAPQIGDAGSIFDLGLDLESADQAEPPVPGFG